MVHAAMPLGGQRFLLQAPSKPFAARNAFSSTGHAMRRNGAPTVQRAEVGTKASLEDDMSLREVQKQEMKDAKAGAGISDISEAGSMAAVTEAEVDTEAYRVPWWQPAFTRRREIFMARTAMVGFFSLQVGEILTGEGIFGQISGLTGIPKPVVGIFLAGIVVNNAISAAHPSSPTFSADNQRDVAKRNKLGVQQLMSPTPGFTKRNELYTGRVAMLGFGAALIGELATGKGPAGQLGLQMESPLVRSFSGVLLLAWIALWLYLAKRFHAEGQLRGDTEIY